MGTALVLGLLTLPPPPLDTEFTFERQKLVVVGHVGRPQVEGIPRRVLVGDREVGWVWQKTFDDWGTRVICVARGKDGEPLLFPPVTVWLGR